MLDIFQRLGEKVPTRGYVKRMVTYHCKKAGITRESLGIFAGVRAELYFKGKWTSVSFDSIEELAEKGTDIVFVEKEGIPEVLTDYADKYSIAMVNTRGHLTEYGKDLMNAADRSGAHVVIMADYDASGVKIASESPSDMPWIGANDKMLRYFHLSRGSVAIDSDTKADKAYVRDLVGTGRHPQKEFESSRIDTRFKDVDVDFLDNQRVELDAILAKVGDERFFQYILDTLKELSPKRDYNRAIEIPTEFDAEHEKILEVIDGTVNQVVKQESDEVKEELKEVEGFIDVNEKEREIKQRLKNVLTNDPNYKDFTDKLSELVNSHPFIKNNNNSNKTKDTSSDQTS